MIDSLNSAGAQASFAGPISRKPSHLRLVVNNARAYGPTPAWEAMEKIETALWNDGAFPAEQPSHQRAWDVARRLALRAYEEGALEALPDIAAKAVAASDDSATSLRLIVEQAATWASDKEIVDSLNDALTSVGREDEQPLFAYGLVRLQREELGRSPEEKAEIARLEAEEALETAEYRAERDLPEMIESLPAATSLEDLVAAVCCAQPLVSERTAEDLAVKSIRRLAQTPQPVWRFDPASVACDDEQGRSNQVRHERAVALAASLRGAEEALPPKTAGEVLRHAVGQLDLIDDCRPDIKRLGQAMRRAMLGMENLNERDMPTPIDLWQRHEAPDLPRGLLPPLIEQFAISQGESMGADPAGIAMSALAICAAAISDDIAVQVKKHDPYWLENARLWVGLIGLPSVKKSPIINAAARPLKRLEAALRQTYVLESQAFASLPKAERDMAPAPVLRQHILQDATIESVQEVLKGSPRGVLSMQDELSGWFGAMDKYGSGKGSAADRAFWLQAFNGGSYNVNRIGRGPSIIPNLSVGLLGGIQPEPLRKIMADTVDDGLIQRLLPVVLQAADVGKDEPIGESAVDYDRMVERLSRLQPVAGRGNMSPTVPVQFSEAARPIRERLEREHHELGQALESSSPKLAAHFGKYNGIFARLCLIWHCVEAGQGPLAPEISEGIAERVAAFMEHFLRPNAIAFYVGMLGMSAGHDDLIAIAAYIVSEDLEEVDARTIQRSLRALRPHTADEVRRLCEKLESFGWLVSIESRQRSNSARWSVVPAVHDMFAERGRLETERRAAGREAIKSAFRAQVVTACRSRV